MNDNLFRMNGGRAGTRTPGLFRVKEGVTFRLNWLRSVALAGFALIRQIAKSFTHRFTHQLSGAR